jgi:nicotinamide-nucleotide amidase
LKVISMRYSRAMNDDIIRLATAVVDELAGRRLACAESLTAGRLTTAFASVDNAVTFLRGGVVAYQPGVKANVLGVTAESVLSTEAAEQMACGVADLLDAQVSVATTGLAGGEPEDGIEVGTVFIGTFVSGLMCSSRHRFDGAPEEICDAATRQALENLFGALCARVIAAPTLAGPPRRQHSPHHRRVDAEAVSVIPATKG